MNETGYEIDTIFATGGGTKNPVFLRAHTDATGCRLVLPAEPEAVLLGAAMLGAVAGGNYTDVRSAMAAMSGSGEVMAPDPVTRAYHDRKYQVFKQLWHDQKRYAAIMGAGGAG
jgi:ribulose kinase